MHYSKLVFKIYSIVSKIVYKCDLCINLTCEDCIYNDCSLSRDIFKLIESEVLNGKNEKNAECGK